MNDNVLVVGTPRSGTTWLCEVLSRCRGVDVVLEPDNEKTSWLAWRLKRHLLRFPTLHPGITDASFAQLWNYAFQGRFARTLSRGFPSGYLKLKRGQIERTITARECAAVAGRSVPARSSVSGWDEWMLRPSQPGFVARRIVKSVHSPFCADWVVQQTNPKHVVLIVRHPLGTIASMQRLAMDDAFRAGSLLPHLNQAEKELVERYAATETQRPNIRLIALQVLKMQQHLLTLAQNNSQWTMIQFEEICAAPVNRFRQLFETLQCPWDARIESSITAMNRAGSGYQTRRIASDQIDRWKKELSPCDIKAIEDTFPSYFAGEHCAAMLFSKDK